MADGDMYPRCGQPLVVRGSYNTRGVRFGFRPEELRLFSLNLPFPAAPVPAGASAGAAGGLVWTEVDAATRRQKLYDLGSEEVRQRLGLLAEETTHAESGAAPALATSQNVSVGGMPMRRRERRVPCGARLVTAEK